MPGTRTPHPKIKNHKQISKSTMKCVHWGMILEETCFLLATVPDSSSAREKPLWRSDQRFPGLPRWRLGDLPGQPCCMQHVEYGRAGVRAMGWVLPQPSVHTGRLQSTVWLYLETEPRALRLSEVTRVGPCSDGISVLVRRDPIELKFSLLRDTRKSRGHAQQDESVCTSRGSGLAWWPSG